MRGYKVGKVSFLKLLECLDNPNLRGEKRVAFSQRCVAIHTQMYVFMCLPGIIPAQTLIMVH